MLIVNIKANREELAELHIWNTGKTLLDKETFIYRITMPTKYSTHTILHKREDGFASLVKKAMDVLETHKD